MPRSGRRSLPPTGGSPTWGAPSCCAEEDIHGGSGVAAPGHRATHSTARLPSSSSQTERRWWWYMWGASSCDGSCHGALQTQPQPAAVCSVTAKPKPRPTGRICSSCATGCLPRRNPAAAPGGGFNDSSYPPWAVLHTHTYTHTRVCLLPGPPSATEWPKSQVWCNTLPTHRHNITASDGGGGFHHHKHLAWCVPQGCSPLKLLPALSPITHGTHASTHDRGQYNHYKEVYYHPSPRAQTTTPPYCCTGAACCCWPHPARRLVQASSTDSQAKGSQVFSHPGVVYKPWQLVGATQQEPWMTCVCHCCVTTSNAQPLVKPTNPAPRGAACTAQVGGDPMLSQPPTPPPAPIGTTHTHTWGD
jgi:hypothetical protein